MHAGRPVWRAIGEPDVGLVKVDTEGTEHLVIRGAIDLLASSRPTVVCEVLPRAAMGELTGWLGRSEYRDVRLRGDVLVVSGRVGFDPQAWNHAFVPSEKLAELEEAACVLSLALHHERAR